MNAWEEPRAEWQESQFWTQRLRQVLKLVASQQVQNADHAFALNAMEWNQRVINSVL
jgi:hypothetical protein